MSSTPDSGRGQALPIFVLSLTVLMFIAALAFDGGMLMLERRDEQNAADAAAIAGARYVVDDKPTASSTALDVAQANGFDSADGQETVTVNIPPTSGPNTGKKGYIEVLISSTRPSIFAGIAGIANWDIGARAVAVNEDGAVGAFSILELDEHACAAFKASGSGTVEAHGDIHVNSDCDRGAFVQAGGSTISVDAGGGYCKVYSDDPNAISDGGSGFLNCLPGLDAGIIDDPLYKLSPPDPKQLVLSPDMELLDGPDPALLPPDGCPGSASEPVLDDANTYGCHIRSNFDDAVWRLHPGVYLGGLQLQAGTYYLEPGIYYLAGGGLDIGPDVGFVSVDPGRTTVDLLANPPTDPGGGVLIYSTAARVGLSSQGAILDPMGTIVLNGGDADVGFLPIDDGEEWSGISIWQDRDFAINGDDITINGGDSDMDVRGTIYAAQGDLKVNGNAGTVTLDQLINNTTTVQGNGGNITALNDLDYVVKVRLAGLIE